MAQSSAVSNLSPLIGTEEEINVVTKLLSTKPEKSMSRSPTCEVKHQATVDGVIDRMPYADILHMACHGHQVRGDPLSSGFSMADGRLSVSKLMSVDLQRAQFALLSACESAAGDQEQPDECVNLASTLLFAGFKSVVGTMW